MARTQRVEIRLSTEELAQLEAKAAAAGMTKSALLRDHLGRLRIRPREDQQALLRQVARVGNNLNQLARWANTYRSAVEAVEILGELRRIRDQVEDLTRWRS